MASRSFLTLYTITIFLIIPLPICWASLSDCTSECTLKAVHNSQLRFLALKNKGTFRIISLTLKVANDSTGSTLSANVDGSYDVNKWTWAQKNYGQSYLALPFDINIFSAGTLTFYQTAATINFTATPDGCLNDLSEECKRSLVGQFLSGITQTSYDKHMLCHRVTKAKSVVWLVQNQLTYECCDDFDRLSGNWDCNNIVELNGWLQLLYIFIYAAIILAILLLPEKIIEEISEEFERWFHRSPIKIVQPKRKSKRDKNNDDYKIDINNGETMLNGKNGAVRQLFDFDKYHYTELIALDGEVPIQALPSRWSWKHNRCYIGLLVILSPSVIIIFLALQLTINRKMFERVYLSSITSQLLYQVLIPGVSVAFGIFAIVGCWLAWNITSKAMVENKFIDWLDDVLEDEDDDDSDDDDERAKDMKIKLPVIFSTHGSHEIVKFHRAINKNRKLLFQGDYWKNYKKWVWEKPIKIWKDAKSQWEKATNACTRMFLFIVLLIDAIFTVAYILIVSIPVLVLFLLIPIPLFYCCLTFLAGVHKILQLKFGSSGCCSFLFMLIAFLLSMYAYLVFIFIMAVSAYLIFYTIAFTIVGVVVNADVCTPYLIFIVVILYYISSSITKRYVAKQLMKRLTFEICESLEGKRESIFSNEKQKEFLGKVDDDEEEDKPIKKKLRRQYTLPPIKKLKNSRIEPTDSTEERENGKEKRLKGAKCTPMHDVKTLFYEDANGLAFIPLEVYKRVCQVHLGSSRRAFLRVFMVLGMILFAFAAIMSFGQLHRLSNLAKPLAAVLIGYLPMLIALKDSNEETKLEAKKLKKQVIMTIYRYAVDQRIRQNTEPHDIHISEQHVQKDRLAHGIILGIF